MNTKFRFLTNLELILSAKITPRGIDKTGGVMMAIPGNPNFLIKLIR
jgi:hypothetical protein